VRQYVNMAKIIRVIVIFRHDIHDGDGIHDVEAIIPVEVIRGHQSKTS